MPSGCAVQLLNTSSRPILYFYTHQLPLQNKIYGYVNTNIYDSLLDGTYKYSGSVVGQCKHVRYHTLVPFATNCIYTFTYNLTLYDVHFLHSCFTVILDYNVIVVPHSECTQLVVYCVQLNVQINYSILCCSINQTLFVSLCC